METRMRIGALAWLGAALAAATLACAGREPARAEGAIAVGTTGDVVRYGIAFGYAVDMAQGKAGEIAVERCRTFKAREAAERYLAKYPRGHRVRAVKQYGGL